MSCPDHSQLPAAYVGVLDALAEVDGLGREPDAPPGGVEGLGGG